MREVNCIVLYDTSDDCNILYTSESIVDVTGYTLEELKGKAGYSLVEYENSKVIQDAGIHIRDQDNMATIMYTKMQHKTEGLVPIEAISGRSYDIVISVVTRADKGEPRLKARYATLQQTYTQACDGTITTQSNLFNQELSANPTISPIHKRDRDVAPEPAACMILNRFTRRLTIEFATKTCESLLGVDADRCIGLPFLNYIDPDDIDLVINEFENAKTINSIAQFQFGFFSPQYRQSLPVRVAVFCANDGIIVNIRLAKNGMGGNDGLVFLKYLHDVRSGC